MKSVLTPFYNLSLLEKNTFFLKSVISLLVILYLVPFFVSLNTDPLSLWYQGIKIVKYRQAQWQLQILESHPHKEHKNRMRLVQPPLCNVQLMVALTIGDYTLFDSDIENDFLVDTHVFLKCNFTRIFMENLILIYILLCIN